MLTKTYKNTPPARRGLPLLAALGGTLAALPALAQTQVTLNTGGLSGQGTFFLDFQLLDGSGVGDGNTTFVLSNLSLTGGTLGLPLPGLGAVTGDPTTAAGMTLADSDPIGVALFQQPFTVSGPASLLSFTLDSTSTPPLDAPIPDTFNLLVLEGDGATPLPTQAPNIEDLVVSSYDTSSPTVTGYATSSDSPVPLTVSVASPTGAPAVPEPAPVALLPVGLLALSPIALRARRKRPR